MFSANEHPTAAMKPKFTLNLSSDFILAASV